MSFAAGSSSSTSRLARFSAAAAGPASAAVIPRPVAARNASVVAQAAVPEVAPSSVPELNIIPESRVSSSCGAGTVSIGGHIDDLQQGSCCIGPLGSLSAADLCCSTADRQPFQLIKCCPLHMLIGVSKCCVGCFHGFISGATQHAHPHCTHSCLLCCPAVG